MRDRYDRKIEYMRISITDRCNLRCTYCMPHGIKQVGMEEILTYDEILQVVRAAAGIGIRYIKITGGEPLVRKGCTALAGRIKAVPGIEKVTITTNGVELYENLQALLDAGIDGINISLDTVDPEKYRTLTGSDRIEAVLRAVRACCSCGIRVKLNAVVMKDTEWRSLIGFAENNPVDVRFIEMMPIGPGREYMVKRDILNEIRSEYPDMKRDEEVHGPGPACYYSIPGFEGSIGFISAVHDKFCGHCNRIRLTSMGYLKTCLCFGEGTDLRAILREDDLSCERKKKVLEEAMRTAVYNKPEAHCFGDVSRMTENGRMVSIGG
ncbi:MAG: GTP 3',8-cyclase MoaA [Eubacterium sp.]|nr:GTP 3',8-cyclase MoaA [Eubacterium sp.]